MNLLRSGLFVLAAMLIFSGCKKNAPPPPVPQPGIDLASVRLNDFALTETDYATIQITHPTVVNGTQTAEGNIRVVIPAGSTGLQLTPRPVNFNNNDFNIIPAMGVVQNFSTGPIVYTISSKTQADKKVSYRVSISEQPSTGGGQPQLTGFRFERSRNPQLNDDVVASEIIDGVGTLGKVFIFLPAGTDFSSLNPTINFTGEGVFFSQDPFLAAENYTNNYPASGLNIDFAYPKRFFVSIRKENDIRLYEVIADVVQPLVIQDANVTMPAVDFGSSAFLLLSRVTNVGNHPVSVAGISHFGQTPMPSTAIRATAAFPAEGLLPGASWPVNVNINGINNPPGFYTTTAAIVPKFTFNEGAETYLLPAQVSISATINN